MINYYERAKSDPLIFKQFTFKEILCINYDCPIETNKQDKWSQHNYFLYIVSGKKALHASGRTWLLTEGSAVFIRKGACIIEKFFDETLCLVAFFMPDSFLRSFLAENGSLVPTPVKPATDDNLVIRLAESEVMHAYYQSVLPYFSSQQQPPDSLMELKFRELLLNLLSDRANEELNSYFHTLRSLPAEGLRRVMEANCYFNLTLEDFTKLCNRSLSSFKRDFEKTYRTSPHDWLLKRKLSQASHLLLTSTSSVSDISFDCGFENSAHFSRAFKKIFGQSPLQHRKQKNVQSPVNTMNSVVGSNETI